MFEGVATGGVGLDEDHIRLGGQHLIGEIEGAGQDGGHLVTGQGQGRTDIGGPLAGGINDQDSEHGGWHLEYTYTPLAGNTPPL